MTKPDHTPADEKAVAEEINRLDCGCQILQGEIVHERGCVHTTEVRDLLYENGMRIAARIRADASGEVAALLEDAASMIRAEVEEGAWSSSPTYEDGEGGCVCLGCGDTNGSHGAKCIAMRANALLARIDAALKGDA